MAEETAPCSVFLKFRNALVNVAFIGSIERWTQFNDVPRERIDTTRISLGGRPQRYWVVKAPFDQVLEFIVGAIKSGPGIYDLQKAFPPVEEKRS
jgi:hypothetical protein